MNRSVLKRMVAVALSGGATAVAAAGTHPVRLVTSVDNQQLRVKVVGEGTAPFRGSYQLEVSSGARTGNRSVQRGNVTLTPGGNVVLVDLSLGAAARDAWDARLTVSDERGTQLYEERAS